MILALNWPLRYLPEIRNAGTFPMDVPDCNRVYRGTTMAIHLHEYSGDLWQGRTRFRLQPGDVTLTPSHLPSRYDLKESGTHLCIHFVPPASSTRLNSVRVPLHFRLGPQTATARERMWRTIDHARQGVGKSGTAPAAAASASMQELLLWLHAQVRRGAAPRRSSLMEEALEKFLQAMEQSLGEQRLIEDLAHGTGLSADYVARLFAKRYGMTAQHYQLLRRIELARHLLRSTDLRVSEIGRRVGLPDPQYFNKQFRRVAGESPLAYRTRGTSQRRRRPTTT